MVNNKRTAIKEALESTTPARERTSLQRYQGMSSLATQNELTLQRDMQLRFLREVSNMDCDDMTVEELILILEEGT